MYSAAQSIGRRQSCRYLAVDAAPEPSPPMTGREASDESCDRRERAQAGHDARADDRARPDPRGRGEGPSLRARQVRGERLRRLAATGRGWPPSDGSTSCRPATTARRPAVRRLLRFFAITDIHITDVQSPAQAIFFGYKGFLSSAYSGVMLYTHHVLDAAVKTVNALHAEDPIDFGISLGDTCNNTQYNELRWYIDVARRPAHRPRLRRQETRRPPDRGPRSSTPTTRPASTRRSPGTRCAATTTTSGRGSSASTTTCARPTWARRSSTSATSSRIRVARQPRLLHGLPRRADALR